MSKENNNNNGKKTVPIFELELNPRRTLNVYRRDDQRRRELSTFWDMLLFLGYEWIANRNTSASVGTSFIGEYSGDSSVTDSRQQNRDSPIVTNPFGAVGDHLPPSLSGTRRDRNRQSLNSARNQRRHEPFGASSGFHFPDNNFFSNVGRNNADHPVQANRQRQRAISDDFHSRQNNAAALVLPGAPNAPRLRLQSNSDRNRINGHLENNQPPPNVPNGNRQQGEAAPRGRPQRHCCCFCYGTRCEQAIHQGLALPEKDEDGPWSDHPSKRNGVVVCPVLRQQVCDICGATGDFAHTTKYHREHLDQFPPQ